MRGAGVSPAPQSGLESGRRVCFNLAENRSDAESPFAFLATYTVRLSAHSKAQHLPLGQALREYEGPANRDRSCRCCCRCNEPRRAARG